MGTPFPGSDDFTLRESRIATGVSSMVNAKPPSFSTVTLRDHEARELHDLRSPRAREDVRTLMPANNCGIPHGLLSFKSRQIFSSMSGSKNGIIH